MLKSIKMLCAMFIIGSAFTSGAYARAQLPPGFEERDDVCYSVAGGNELHFDLMRPTTKIAPLPLVICIHGGGWGAGTKREMEGMMRALAASGYCAVSIDYRLAPVNRFPAAVTDVKTALQYFRTNAKALNIDTQKIGVIGGSAGGHLALFLATTTADVETLRASSQANPCPIKAAISIAGPTDLGAEMPKLSQGVVEGFIGKKRSEAPELVKQASPINYVSRYSAPMLIIHGDKDPIVPYDQALSFLAKAKTVGATTEFFHLVNGGHGVGATQKDNEDSVRAMVAFLNKYLK